MADTANFATGVGYLHLFATPSKNVQEYHRQGADFLGIGAFLLVKVLAPAINMLSPQAEAALAPFGDS